MKLKEFRKKMEKSVFSTAEARIVCVGGNPDVLNLQLHQWKKAGDLVSLKRGIYMFTDAEVTAAEIARSLYEPCYFSLEYVLSFYGIMPEATFEYTLVTPKATRRFVTPRSVFNYQTIKKEAFFGFDPETLMAEKEKALVDYFYLHRDELEANDRFWDDSRMEASATEINFNKVFRYSTFFDSPKLTLLLHSFQSYAKSHQAS